MRSELINDIFSVETEAERIVEAAGKQALEAVSRAHENGAELVRTVVEDARNNRYAKVESAQSDSLKKVEALQEMVGPPADTIAMDELRIARISDAIVRLLCSSWCVETEKR